MANAQLLLGLVLLTQVPAPDAATKVSAELHRQEQAILERERADLKTIADRLEAVGSPAGARSVRAAMTSISTPNGATLFRPLPEVVSAKGAEKGLAAVAAQGEPAPSWQAQVDDVQRKAAEAYFDLANRAANATPRHYALADRCLRAVIARQPNHAEARRLLGYVPHRGGWATPYAVQKLKDREVQHPPYGWVPESWVPHLEKGELPAPLRPGQKEPRWVTTEEADRLHADWATAWRISTEHFHVQTNVPLAEAIAFGQQLEVFHELFFSLLADVFADQGPLAQRFRNKRMVGEPVSRSLHRVEYYASQQEYVERLRPFEGPDIDKTLGIYVPPRQPRDQRGTAFFFRDERVQLSATATLFHEVSHQLLLESKLGEARAFEKNYGNYWVFEGLGTYFETVTERPDGTLEVGGFVGKRVEEALRRIAGQGEYIPLNDFVRFDQRMLHQGDGYLKYQEACALAIFFMQYDGGRYREDFLDYVRDAARGRIKRGSGKSLQERVGTAYKELDAEFLKFLAAAPRPDGPR
jgi:hypothetical protein